MGWLFLHVLFSEPKPKACHPEEETAKNQDWSQLGAFLPQVCSCYSTFQSPNRPMCFFQPTVLTWPSVLLRFQLDHARSNLIWNLKTREELRDALEGEMRAFSVDRELGSANVISWNHQEFEVCAQLAVKAVRWVYVRSAFINVRVLCAAGEIRVPFRWDKDRGLLPAAAARGGRKRRNECHQEIVRPQHSHPTSCTDRICLHWTLNDDSFSSISLLSDTSSSTNSTIAFCLHPKLRWSACACRLSL